MRLAGMICGSWLLSTLGCVSLGEKHPNSRNVDVPVRDRRAAEMCNACGLEQVERGEWKEAEFFFRRSMALDGGYAAARNNLALVLMHQGRAAEAASELLRAQALDPEATEPRKNFERLSRVIGESCIHPGATNTRVFGQTCTEHRDKLLIVNGER